MAKTPRHLRAQARLKQDRANRAGLIVDKSLAPSGLSKQDLLQPDKNHKVMQLPASY